jgi:hypothetical protein
MAWWSVVRLLRGFTGLADAVAQMGTDPAADYSGLVDELRLRDATDVVHVAPRDDLVAHELEGLKCPCGPATQPGANGAVVVVHHALDGRA